MAIKCPKCNKSDAVVCYDGPYFSRENEIEAVFICDDCDVSFRAEFAIEPLNLEILKEGDE